MKCDTSTKCTKGCDKYNKSIDEIYEAGLEHKNKLIDLKKIADEQKVKIGCLRKHRDEIKNDLYKLEDVHEATIKEHSEKVKQLDEEIDYLKKRIDEQRDKIYVKSKAIEDLMSVEANFGVERISPRSLEEELCLDRFKRLKFKCKYCETHFLTSIDLKKHVKDTHVECRTSQK